MIEWILFAVLALGAVGSALLVVTPVFGRNPLYAALSLVVSLTCVAGLYLLLAAHLVAVMQVLVYVGAVMVLFLFVIMLLNLSHDELGPPRITFAKVLGTLAAGGLFAGLAWRRWLDPPLGAGVDLGAPAQEGFGWVSRVATRLFSDFLVPFELLSVFLLVAIMGAVILARREI